MLKTRKKTPYILCILFQSVVFGLGNPLTKIAYLSMTPLWCLAIRFVLAAALMFVFFGPGILKQLMAAPVAAWLPGSLCLAANRVCGNLALDLATATNVGFLTALPVVFTPFLSLFLLKRKLSLRSLPVLGLVVAGLYLLCSCGGHFSFGWGEALALLSSLFLALALVLSERHLAEVSPVAMATAQMAATALVCLLAAFIFDDPASLAQVKLSAWLVTAYLAVICTSLAYVLQNLALTRMTSSAVSMLQCTQPILTAVFSYWILKENLSAAGLIGAAIITVCVVYENYVNYRREKRAVQIQAP